MTGFTDRLDLGVFPLQDHDPDVPLSVRQSIAGGRVVRMVDPEDGNAEESLVEYGRDQGMGTLGDIHPWLFLQTRNRAVRGNGAWVTSFASSVVSGGDYYDAYVQPFRDGALRNDSRFTPVSPGWPACFPRTPRGSMLAIYPAMEEHAQLDVALWADPRLVAPNISGPGEAGTLVVDLQPEGELCMSGSREPGVGGRHARLQSLVRVVPVNPAGSKIGQHNILAAQFAGSGIEKMPGFGAAWCELAGFSVSPPITPPSGSGRGVYRGPGDTVAFATTRVGGGAFGEGVSSLTDDDAKAPHEFGEFRQKKTDSRGVAFQSQSMSGPFHGGAIVDKHRIDVDADGCPVNAGHIATGAYFFRNQDEDGPLLFEGGYPYPPPWPLISRVHLSWDPAVPHRFVGGTRQGVWRWWAEVPYVAPDDEPPLPPITPPSGPTAPPGPGRPTGPGTPSPPRPPLLPPSRPPITGPTTPPPSGPKPKDPRGPTTPPSGPPAPPTPPGGGFRVGREGIPAPAPRPDEGLDVVPLPPDPPDWPEWPNGPSPFSGPTQPWGSTQPRGSRPTGSIDAIGDADGVVSAYSIFHPMQTGFAAVTFRPQLTRAKLPNFEHGPHLPRELIVADERERPQTLVMRAWGNQSAGDWTYDEAPRRSRSRGGTTRGGVLLSPPQFELEDYIAPSAGRVVDKLTTRGYFAAAQGIGYALGEPLDTGGLAPGSVTFDRYDATTTANRRALRVAQIDDNGDAVDMIRARIDGATQECVVDLLGNAVQLPIGTTAQRPSAITPAAGFARVNTSGAVDRLEYFDGSSWLSSFTTSEHVSTSAGAADAGKPVVLNASGLLDASMGGGGGGVTDHGALTGLGDDDHTQYLLADGSRAMTGALSATSITVSGTIDATGGVDASGYSAGAVAGIGTIINFVADGATHDVTIIGGIITDWTIT